MLLYRPKCNKREKNKWAISTKHKCAMQKSIISGEIGRILRLDEANIKKLWEQILFSSHEKEEVLGHNKNTQTQWQVPTPHKFHAQGAQWLLTNCTVQPTVQKTANTP